mgnify:CR=1 FL=1
MFTKLKKALLFTGMSLSLGTGIFLLCSVFDYDDMYRNANIWYKISTDKLDPGRLIALDMSEGYAMCEGSSIYIVVRSADGLGEMVVAFPNGSYWSAPKVDTTSLEIQKAFGKLEQDLRNR